MLDPADRACRICGEMTKLSFEHVPPKGVGNTGRVEMLGIEAWLNREDRSAEVRGTISQRGSISASEDPAFCARAKLLRLSSRAAFNFRS